jgi:hypothetical protein
MTGWRLGSAMSDIIYSRSSKLEEWRHVPKGFASWKYQGDGVMSDTVSETSAKPLKRASCFSERVVSGTQVFSNIKCSFGPDLGTREP